ncbi:MAG TPA: ATP-binding protein [Anaerolineaceae bacterium]|nr:ATP-binding protein [Anaerolineaceae bacterium]
MGNLRDRILVVEHDPVISDLIGRQALQSIGYQVQMVGDATAAIPQAIQFLPDVLIVDLNLPGLSGKDLLVALASQGIEIPVMVVAQKGMESDVIQAFRLGATDYMLWPLRDAEVVSAVERVLKQVHERREREHLSRQLQQTNTELQSRVRELTTIFSVGKAVTSITDQKTLFDKIVDGAVRVTEADLGWFLMREDNGKNYILTAYRNLPISLQAKLHQPWDDGISSLVAMSGETLSIHGEPLKRFKVSSLGQSAMIVPVKVQRQTVGLMVVIRKTPRAFTASEQNLLEAVADYASISLVNSRLFRALEERARNAQQAAEAAQAADKAKDDILQCLVQELRGPLDAAKNNLNQLAEGQKSKITPDQRQILLTALDRIQKLGKGIDLVASLANPSRAGAPINLSDLVRQILPRFQRLAQQNGLALMTELPAEPVLARADSAQIAQVLDGLISNAVKYSQPGGQILIRVDKNAENSAHVLVRDTGAGIDSKDLAQIFNRSYHKEDNLARKSGQAGIGLSLIKEIVSTNGGNIWVESKPGQGSVFHFTLLSPK